MTHLARALRSDSGGQLDLPTGLMAATWWPTGGRRRVCQLTAGRRPLATEALAWIGGLLLAGVPAAVARYRHTTAI